ncbi:MAG: PucR family transcriptional regulator [Firmicutes bacterium]|nr:PucR family transcriptional regulator [Bacillota bacterium]
MRVTVEDICNFPEFSSLRVIAGRGGLNNVVERCGVLDYEFVDGVKDKWYNTNFREENMIVITSFLYAKDNDHLILDAVKKLVSRKCKGLIIKNIFNLPIKENVIRYADTMNFPIILIEGSDIHYEDLIILINQRAKHYSSIYYRENKVDEILRNGSNNEVVEKLTYEINPSFKSDMIAMYFEPLRGFSVEDYLKIEAYLLEKGIITTSDSVFYYKGGFFVVLSRDMFSTIDEATLIKPVLDAFGGSISQFRVGVSTVHHLIYQIKQCFEEATYAAKLKTGMETPVMLYENLGLYKIILPFCENDSMREFARKYIKPLEDFDLETNGNLLETAVAYVMNDGDLQKTADAMIQHKNTIRYRLKNISNLLEMNIFETKNYETLSFAVKIYVCNDKVI